MMDPELKAALKLQLLGMADDELILGHRNSEWTGHGPILEEDIAFSNIAQDEIGHAWIWYSLLEALTGDNPDRLVFFRDAHQYRNVQLAELPKGDWAFTLLRQYFFDALENVRLAALLKSAYQPFADAAAKIRKEEAYHYRHTSAWVRRLGLGTEESRKRMQSALQQMGPFIDQLFIPLAGQALLAEAGCVPDPDELRSGWENRVFPLLRESELCVAQNVKPVASARDQHTEHLSVLLMEMQEVARLDPQAQW